MAEYSKGILGAFSGKVGPVVGANWRGKDIMRSMPKKTNREPSEKQLLQQQKFACVTRFVTPLGMMLGRYFGQNMGDRSKKNMAMSYHLKEAVAYNGTNHEMLYDKVQISKGDLLGFSSPTIEALEGGVIHFTWKDNSGQVTAKANDQLIAVVYDPESNTSDLFFNVALRSATQGVIQLQNFMVGAKVECWIGFVSFDEKKYATSNYMGQIKVL